MNRHRIRGHRWRGTKRLGAAAFRDPKESMRQLGARVIATFAEIFLDAVKAGIHERITAGRWHRSKNRRYSAYRTWLQYRYGSDRARKAMPGVALPEDQWVTRDYGGRRKNIIKRMQTPGAFEAMPEILREPIMFAQFDYIRRVLLNRAELYTPNASAVARRFLTPQQREARYKLRLGKDDTVDVHEAVQFLQEFMLGTRDPQGVRSSNDGYIGLLRAGKRKEADERKRKYAAELNKQSEIFSQWMRESPAAQRLLRKVHKRTLQASRATFTLQASERARAGIDQIANSGRENAPSRDAMRVYRNTPETQARAKRIMQQYRSGRRITPISAGNFAFGYQTGQLAEAWRVADDTAKRINNKWRFTITPKEAGDKLPRGSLTTFLKRIIARQGGNPNLVTKPLMRRAMREAVTDANVRAAWSSMGVRYRRSTR